MSIDRRTFLQRTALTAAAAALPMDRALADGAYDGKPAQSHLELRAYRLRAGAPQALLDGYLQDAFIPAANRAGVQAVGVFTEPAAPDGAAVWVLMQHRSLEAMSRLNAAINTDSTVLAAATDYLRSPTKAAPAFDRIDTWLYLAFAGMPQLEVPALGRARSARVFELRVYESFSELKALKKVEMFNAGEIDVMKELALSPVFYGQGLVGRDLPHLAYMLCSPDRATHDANWKRFLDHPTWKRLLADPQYADTVSKITSRFLVPTSYSQI